MTLSGARVRDERPSRLFGIQDRSSFTPLRSNSARHAASHGKYVVQWNGQRIKQIHRAFYRAAKEAGVRASPHTLRHTRATWVMQHGDVPPWEAAGHLGMSLKTLQKYAKHSPDFQKRAAEV